MEKKSNDVSGQKTTIAWGTRRHFTKTHQLDFARDAVNETLLFFTAEADIGNCCFTSALSDFLLIELEQMKRKEEKKLTF